MKSLSNALFWTASSTLIKILIGLLSIKILALYLGAEGMGRAANFMTLLTVLGVFSGAGIFNGITKYVAEYEENPSKLAALLSTSSFIVLLFSCFVALIFLLFCQVIAQFLFNDSAYSWVIIALAFCQIGIAYSNFLLAILKGLRDAKHNALSLIIGSLLGFTGFVFLSHIATGEQLNSYQFQFTFIGLALIPALIFLPAQYFLQKCGSFSPYFQTLLKPQWHSEQAKKLAKFSIMVLITAITLPLSYIVMRNQLADIYGISAVGLWQGMMKISDAYLQFITAAFSVYLLPTFAKLHHFNAIKKELYKALLIVLLTVSSVSVLIYFCRGFIIHLLFTDEFMPMQALFVWQLIGDVCKVCSYVFGYLIVAKALLSFYILAEFIQATLLLTISAYFIPQAGVVGAAQAYMWTYIIYFCCCVLGFISYSVKKNKVANIG